MDREYQRLGAHRVVDIYAETERGSYGSGYAVGDDLVLTAAHVVKKNASSFLVRTLDYKGCSAELVWADYDIDAALLRVAGKPWKDTPDSGSLRWGRVSGNEVNCWALGFPRAQEDAERRRDVDTMRGTVNATTGYRGERYWVEVTYPVLPAAADGQSWWQGMSGAALFGTGRELLGVIVEAAVFPGTDPGDVPVSRLEVVPVKSLFSDPAFCRLVGAKAQDAEHVFDRGPVSDLDGPTLLLPPYRELPPGASDAQLLLAGYGVVPFLGREPQLGSLRRWVSQLDRFGVAVVTGDQGAGKTRLGAELCKQTADAGWSAGFMDVDAMNVALVKGTQIEVVWPTLLVIDEPDRLTDEIIALIDLLGRRVRGARLRVLLLDRTPAGAGNDAPLPDDVTWWRRLNRGTEGLVAGRTSVTIRLGSGLLTGADQRRHIAAAVAQYGQGAATAPPELTDPSPLRLHLAALNAVRGEVQRPGDPPEKLLLNRETTRWLRLLAEHHLTDLGEERAKQALTLVTMTAPTGAEAVDLLTALPALDAGDASKERRFQIAEWLVQSYPGRSRLGLPSHSAMVDQLLDDTPGLGNIVVSVHDHPARTTRHLVTMLGTLRLAAARQGAARAALYELLSTRLTELMEAVAGQPDSRLPAMVDGALEVFGGPDTRGALAAAASTLRQPQPTGQFTTDHLRCRLLELAVDWHERQPAAALALADALTDLTAYRAALGDLPGARAAAESALERYRKVTDVSRASFARATGNVGVCLAMAGELDRAASLLAPAAAAFQDLAAHDHGFAPSQVDVLISLAACQADEGRQALAIRTLLSAVTARGREGALVGLIEPLGNLAQGLARDPRAPQAAPPDPRCYRLPASTAPWTARDDRAREDTLIRLTARLTIGIADKTPTALRNAVLPALVPALARQQARYAAWNHAEYLRLFAQTLARRDEFEYASLAAVESVTLFRRIAAADPDAVRKIPEVLERLANYSARAGRLDEAIAHAGESVDQYRLLFARDPGIALRLADALEGLAGYLKEADRLPEAIERQQEAVALYGTLANLHERYRPSLGDARTYLGLLLMDAGRPDEAAATLRGAITLFADLAREIPQYAARLADASGLLAAVTSWGEDPAGYVAAVQRAVDLERDRAVAGQDTPIEYLTNLLILSSTLAAAGRLDEALDKSSEAVARIRDQEEESDDELRRLMGWGLSVVAETARGLGRLDDALVAADESVAILIQLDSTDPDAAVILGSAFGAQAGALLAAGRPDEAVPPALRSLELLGHRGISPGLTALPAATTQAWLGLAQLQLGRAEEAAASALAARAELQRLSGPIVQGMLAETYFCEGCALVLLDRPGDALQSLTQAEQLFASPGSPNPSANVGLARTLATIGTCHLTLGDADRAREYAERSLALLDGPGEFQPVFRLVRKQALGVRGESASLMGDDAAGYRDYQELLALYDAEPPLAPADRAQFAVALAKCGLYGLELGDPEQAASLFTQAVAVFHDLDPGLYSALSLLLAHAQALAGLAGCQAAAGDVAAAAQTAAEGAELLRGHYSPAESLLALQHGKLVLFQVSCLMGLEQDPREKLDEAIEILRPLSIPEATVELIPALNLRASYRYSLGDFAGAAEPAATAAELCRTVDGWPPGPMVLASTLRLLGACRFWLGHFDDALASLGEAAGLFAELSTTSAYPAVEHAEVELRRGMCLAYLNRTAEVATHLQKTLDVLRLPAASDPAQQPSLAELLMQLCQDVIGVGQELESFRRLPAVGKILQAGAGILGRLGYQDAAVFVKEQARQLT